MKRPFASIMAVLLTAFVFHLASQVGAAQSAGSGAAEAQDAPPQAAAPQIGDLPFRRDSAPEIKPYDKVITKDAKSDAGVFTVHRIKDKVYYEIPKSELDKDFLWVSQIARTTLGVGYGGQAAGNHVVRWERHGNRILLRNYVVQPEDKVDPALLIPGIGPYDKWATMWGYKPIPGAHTPDEEKKTLDEWRECRTRRRGCDSRLRAREALIRVRTHRSGWRCRCREVYGDGNQES